MLKVIKAFLLFALMAAIPIAADNLLHSRPDVPLKKLPVAGWFGGIPESAALWLLIFLAAVFAIYYYIKVHDRLDDIQWYLEQAERDLNALLSSAREHGGRKDRAVERSVWNQMSASPAIQIFTAGYRTPAHDLIDVNQKELASKGSALGKATTTAMLFRELYEGGVPTAQSRIMAEVRNGGDVPYVAPGISELIGFDKFDKENGFPEGAGVDKYDLREVIERGGFPTQNLMTVKTNAAGQKTVLRGNEVLLDLTQQKA